MSCLIVSFSNHCILASSLLVLVWFFSLRDLELMVIFMTRSSSSKTEFTCFFYDVFNVGGSAGSSLLEVSLLFLLGIPPLPLHCFDATRLPLSNKLEFAQFGAHLQKLWKFWSSLECTCFRGLGIRLAPAVVPRSTAVVPPKHSRQEPFLCLIHFELLQNFVKVCAL